MYKIVLNVFLLILVLVCCPAAYSDNVNLGISIGEEGLRGFHMSIGNHYRVPEREVVYIRERRIPEPEIPVVLHVSRCAHVPPAQVIELRRSGRSWMSIVSYYRLSPEIFYVPSSGGPHGHAYGHKKHWKKLHLRDSEVVRLTNVKFISEHHRVHPDKVMRLRAEGRSFAAIDAMHRGKKEHQKEHKKEKGKGKSEDAYRMAGFGDSDRDDHGRGNGRGWDDDGGKGRGKGHGKH